MSSELFAALKAEFKLLRETRVSSSVNGNHLSILVYKDGEDRSYVDVEGFEDKVRFLFWRPGFRSFDLVTPTESVNEWMLSAATVLWLVGPSFLSRFHSTLGIRDEIATSSPNALLGATIKGLCSWLSDSPDSVAVMDDVSHINHGLKEAWSVASREKYRIAKKEMRDCLQKFIDLGIDLGEVPDMLDEAVVRSVMES